MLSLKISSLLNTLLMGSMPYTMPGPGSPNGVYLYSGSKRSWNLLRKDGEPFRIGELGNGIYIQCTLTISTAQHVDLKINISISYLLSIVENLIYTLL